MPIDWKLVIILAANLAIQIVLTNVLLASVATIFDEDCPFERRISRRQEESLLPFMKNSFLNFGRPQI